MPLLIITNKQTLLHFMEIQYLLCNFLYLNKFWFLNRAHIGNGKNPVFGWLLKDKKGNKDLGVFSFFTI